MATILTSGVVCDGFDARCLLATGETRVFHWPAPPADLQAAADAVESALEAAAEAGTIDLGEALHGHP